MSVVPPCHALPMRSSTTTEGREAPATLRFARAARVVGEAVGPLGLVAPGFRAPPARRGVDRAIRRTPSGAVVSVRVRGRPFEAVMADMVEGVLVANGLERDEAARARVRLLQALGDLAGDPDRGAEAA